MKLQGSGNMIKSLIQMNNPLKYKEEEWYNTKEKKYNVLNVYSLKEINNHSVFNYVKRSLEILDNINNKNKLDKQTLYLVEETLKWQDVSKTGNKKIRKIWKEKAPGNCGTMKKRRAKSQLRAP